MRPWMLLVFLRFSLASCLCIQTCRWPWVSDSAGWWSPKARIIIRRWGVFKSKYSSVSEMGLRRYNHASVGWRWLLHPLAPYSSRTQADRGTGASKDGPSEVISSEVLADWVWKVTDDDFINWIASYRCISSTAPVNAAQAAGKWNQSRLGFTLLWPLCSQVTCPNVSVDNQLVSQESGWWTAHRWEVCDGRSALKWETEW